MGREFIATPAVRAHTPLLIGLVGPSSSGKTCSALRLATGIRRVSGGSIFVIDTEADRACHHAPKAGETAKPPLTFDFLHVPFRAPFSPADYTAAVESCVNQGAKVIVIDSTSHLHEGPGGVLAMHAEELEKRGGKQTATFVAWAKPKAELRRFINTILGLRVNLLFCFRAKEKLKIEPGKDPRQLGYMPIASDEMIFEMTVNMLLYPGSGGVPTWHSSELGERQIIKLPGQFVKLFEKSEPLSEDIGQKLAEWAAGSDIPAPTATAPSAPVETQAPHSPLDNLEERYRLCSDAATLTTLEAERAALWPTLGRADQRRLKTAADAARDNVAKIEDMKASA